MRRVLVAVLFSLGCVVPASAEGVLDYLLPYDEFVTEVSESFKEYLEKLNKEAYERHMNPGQHWYEADCCHEQDCRPYETREYRRVTNGYVVQYGEAEIFLSDEKMRPRPPHALPDDKLHFCIAATIENPPEGVCWYPATMMY